MTDTERAVDAFDLDWRARWIAPVEGDDLPAFKKGVAFVEASTFACSPTSGCAEAQDSEEVTIDRA